MNRLAAGEGAVQDLGRPPGGLRVLEIGDVAMFKQGVPASTELVWTGHDDVVEGVGRPSVFALRQPAVQVRSRGAGGGGPGRPVR